MACTIADSCDAGVPADRGSMSSPQPHTVAYSSRSLTPTEPSAKRRASTLSSATESMVPL